MGLFDGVSWLAVALGFVAAFGLGWFWYSPRGFYTGWSEATGVRHDKSDNMAAAFGSLIIGLVLLSLFVSVMMARGQCGPLVLGILAFVIMGYSNNAFKKHKAYARTVDAGSWLASCALMIIANWLV